MRALSLLCLALPTAQTMYAVAPVPSRASACSPVMRVLRVREESWPEAQNGGEDRNAFLRATVSDGAGGEEDVAQCGLEVLRVTYDGLMDDEGPGVRQRPVLSGTLFVESQHRRKGVGIRLLRECEGVARRWGFGEMLLMVQQKNKAALRCYAKVGYKPVAEPTKFHGTQVCLRRNLYSPDMHTVHSMGPQRTEV